MALFTREEGSPIYTDTIEVAKIRKVGEEMINSGLGKRTPWWARIIQNSYTFHPNPEILEEWLTSINGDPIPIMDSACQESSSAGPSSDFLDLIHNRLEDRVFFATHAGRPDSPYIRTYELNLRRGQNPVARISEKDPTGQTQQLPYFIVPSRVHLELTAELIRTAAPLAAK